MKHECEKEGVVSVKMKLNNWKLNQDKWLKFLWLNEVWEDK